MKKNHHHRDNQGIAQAEELGDLAGAGFP